MKRNLFVLAVFLLSFELNAQESKFALSGGYVFTNVEDIDEDATGFRINGLYEFNPTEGMLAHDVSMGYIRTTATRTLNSLTSHYTLSSFPVYYSPKVLLGSQSFKAFIKGIIGVHYSGYKRTGELTSVDSWDFGLYTGAGAGLMVNFNKIFVNAEYEWAYLTNSNYRSGFVNTVMGGIGFNF